MDVRLDMNAILPQTPFPASVRAAGDAAQGPTSSVTVSKREFPGLAGTEEVDAATEADAATRDDKLGQLFRQAFNYAPPPMPNFL